jgi:hypothetical protein
VNDVRDGTPLSSRLEVLFATLEHCLAHPPEKGALQEHMLFFNGYEAPGVTSSSAAAGAPALKKSRWNETQSLKRTKNASTLDAPRYPATRSSSGPGRCKDHGLVNGCEVDVKSKICDHPGYDKQRSYGEQLGSPARFCKEHGLVNGCEVDVVCKQCLSAHCPTIVARKNYDEYCFFCFAQLFPDEPRARNYKRKQLIIEEIIKARVQHPDTRFDKTLGACSKRRPDMFFECLTHVVIIKMDEEQHIGYNLYCEQNSINEIYKDIACRPIHLIRFNPDSYTDSLGVRVPGCFFFFLILVATT